MLQILPKVFSPQGQLTKLSAPRRLVSKDTRCIRTTSARKMSNSVPKFSEIMNPQPMVKFLWPERSKFPVTRCFMAWQIACGNPQAEMKQLVIQQTRLQIRPRDLDLEPPPESTCRVSLRGGSQVEDSKFKTGKPSGIRGARTRSRVTRILEKPIPSWLITSPHLIKKTALTVSVGVRATH